MTTRPHWKHTNSPPSRCLNPKPKTGISGPHVRATGNTHMHRHRATRRAQCSALHDRRVCLEFISVVRLTNLLLIINYAVHSATQPSISTLLPNRLALSNVLSIDYILYILICAHNVQPSISASTRARMHTHIHPPTHAHTQMRARMHKHTDNVA